MLKDEARSTNTPPDSLSEGQDAPRDSEEPPAKREKRSRKGCATCRARRVKCDETGPVCGPCNSRKLECTWFDESNATVSGHDFAQSLNKPKGKTACVPCRRRKIKCSGLDDAPDDDQRCSRCRRLKLSCTWQTRISVTSSLPPSADEGSRRSTFADIHDIPPRSGMWSSSSQASMPFAPLSCYEAIMANKSELFRLIRVYFGTVHQWGGMTFIHEPSLFRLLEKGKAPKALTRLMLALSIRFAGDKTPETFTQADALFEEAFQEVKYQTYEGFGAIQMMETLLARTYEQARGHFSSSWILLGNAMRMMQWLNLHTFDETYPRVHAVRLNPLLKPEALRRLAWAIFYLDTVADAGRHGVHIITDAGLRNQLPCDEKTFTLGIDIKTQPLDQFQTISHASRSDLPLPDTPSAVHAAEPMPPPPVDRPPSNIGILGHLLRTAAIRRRVLHFNYLLRYNPAPPEQLLADLDLCVQHLNRIIADLPSDLAYNDDNLFVHADFRGAFILLHMFRHNCFLMVAWCKLNIYAKYPKDPILADMVPSLLRERLRHAFQVANIISDAMRLCVTVDPFIGHQAYTSLEILLFDSTKLARFDPSIDRTSPRYTNALESLLGIIRQLALVDVSDGHLRVEACHRLIHCGLQRCLTQADWDACRSNKVASGPNDTEFDFRVFRWHRNQNLRRGQQKDDRTPQAAEALLDLGSHTASQSRVASPSPEPGLRADSSNTAPGYTGVDLSAPSNQLSQLPLDPLMDAGQLIFGQPTPSRLSITRTPGAAMPHGPPTGSDGFHSSLDDFFDPSPLSGTTAPFSMAQYTSASAPEWFDQRRWFNLDYQSGFTAPLFETPLPQMPPTFPQDVVRGDDFTSFLQQAGYAGSSDVDPLAWMTQS